MKQRTSRTFDRQQADVWQGMPTFVMSATDTGNVGNRHLVCLHPPAELELGPTVGLHK